NEGILLKNGQKTGMISGFSGFLINIKYLLKGKVLLANVLPVFTAYWLALYFSVESFMDHIPLFLLTITGCTIVISGELMLNKWYTVQLGSKLVCMCKLPSVTGAFSPGSYLCARLKTSAIW